VMEWRHWGIRFPLPAHGIAWHEDGMVFIHKLDLSVLLCVSNSLKVDDLKSSDEKRGGGLHVSLLKLNMIILLLIPVNNNYKKRVSRSTFKM
jgi:hypothetical protein